MATNTDRPAPATARPPRRRFHGSRLLGAAFFVFFIAGFVLLLLPPYVYSGTLEEYASAFDEVRINLAVLNAYIILPVAGILLMWSAAHLGGLTRPARTRPSVAAQLATAGAAVTALGVVVAASATSAAIHVAVGSPDGGFPAQPAVAYGLEMFSGQVINPSLFGLSLMMVALAVGLRRAGRMPGWLAWTGCILAPILPFAWTLGMIPLLLGALWVAIATAVVNTEPHD